MHPDDVYGNEEMVGFSLGKLANTMFNPIQHARMLASAGGAAAGALGRAAGFGGRNGMPPAPALAPSMAQAGAQSGANTIHAYMGMGAVSWEGTDTALKSMAAEPQSAFIGNRLVIAARYSSGATGRQVTITQPLTVSGMPQTPAPSEPAPIEMFDATATYSRLDLQIATSATQITIGFSIDAAPGSGETVNVSAGLYGEWIR